MNQQRKAWLAAGAGIGLGIAGGIAGIVLPFVVKPSGHSPNPDAGRTLAWGMGIGMTVCFGLFCAMFGYLIAIRPARGTRERSFATVNTVWGSLLAAAFPWLLFVLRNAGPDLQSMGWMIIGVYASIRLIGKWQQAQLRIRAEEAARPESEPMAGV